MKTKLIATLIAMVVSASMPAFAGTPQTTNSLPVNKPNFFCYVPVLKNTPLCNTYNSRMAQQLAPRVPTYNSYRK